ncbi:MaoC/PaaZ C-terminal domain-containing protein [Hydrogenophaga sp.]|uniref:MaoC/PaaZ C-terminal domain-containing protein n=1 Tax=Hydrogenophaga sp. TaxID=1904254 RepID=UPI002717AE09|nr:MaoC/PaaZ C-terminal domain-containing protein [Hydrogenophaga sp.]MDO9439062.1 MaoC/PaaZ C-terminal domain-containing protein [Hydrogenophaga sp.]
MIDDAATRAWSAEVEHRYQERDAIVYALGLGLGADPMDPRQFRHLYEKDLRALPTMAAILASPGFWMRERRELRINASQLLHGEQAVRLHAPLPAAGTVRGTTRVTRIVDKGADKGATLHVEKALHDARTGEHLATTESVYWLRADGGFSQQPGARSDDAAPPAEAMPTEEPELLLDLPTRPDQAFVYRLSGDANPLHVDPEVAAKAGFPRPILHGLATWGIAGWGLVRAFADGDAHRLAGLRARFSAPVFPGETIRLECWRRAGRTAFRARVLERNTLVLNQGWADWH